MCISVFFIRVSPSVKVKERVGQLRGGPMRLKGAVTRYSARSILLPRHGATLFLPPAPFPSATPRPSTKLAQPPVAPAQPSVAPAQPPVAPAQPPVAPAQPPVTLAQAPVALAQASVTPAQAAVTPAQPPETSAQRP